MTLPQRRCCYAVAPPSPPQPFHTFKAAVKDFEYDQEDGQSYIETRLGYFR